MGMLAFIGRAAKKITGAVIETAGKIIPGSIGDAIEDFGWDLRYGSSQLSSSSSSQEIFDVATECLKNCNAVMDKVTPKIRCAVADTKKQLDDLNYDVTILVPSATNLMPDDLFPDIEDVCRQYIGSKISLDNEEYKEILSIPSSSERQQACGAYAEQIIREAMKLTNKAIRDETNGVIDAMISALEDYASVQKEQAQKNQDLLKKLQSASESPDFVVNQCWEKVVNIAFLESLRSLTFSAKYPS